MSPRKYLLVLLSLMMLVSLTGNLMAQSKPAISEPLGKEITETQRSIHALEAELERQNEYLDDLYTVHEKRQRAKSDQVLQMEALQQQINDLTRMMGELTNSVQTLAVKDSVEKSTPAQPRKKTQLYTHQDSLELIILKRREAESRRQIDALTLEIMQLSEELKDPNRRYALAKKLKEQGDKPVQKKTPDQIASPVEIDKVSARAIDLAAVELVRKGQALDQARMSIIDGLDDARIQTFYQELPREERYRLYDLADEIMARDNTDLAQARRSALFFYFYTQ